LASDGSSTPDDATEKEASIDHSKVLLYLQKVMMTSPLTLFLDESGEESGLNHSEPDLPLFDALNKQLHRQERGLSYTKPLLRIDRVCARLIRQASAVFSQIAEAEKRNVLFGRAQDIGMPAMNSPIEMKMSKAVSSSHSSL
jgi:anaphase-promoting complex subunit 4